MILLCFPSSILSTFQFSFFSRLILEVAVEEKVLRLKTLREKTRLGWVLLLRIEVGFVQVQMLCMDDLLAVDVIFFVLNEEPGA